MIRAADEARPFQGEKPTRFAPADNLHDAIRSDLEAIGGGIEFQPLRRVFGHEYPFNDIDWNPFDGE